MRGTGHDPNGTNGTNGTDCGEDANEEGPSASAFGDKVRLSLRSSVHPSVCVFLYVSFCVTFFASFSSICASYNLFTCSSLFIYRLYFVYLRLSVSLCVYFRV